MLTKATIEILDRDAIEKAREGVFPANIAADVSPELAHDIRRVALDAFHALGCRDWARVDVRLDATERPNVMEINPLPGILPDPRQNSCFPKAARAAGLNYDSLIAGVLDTALRRYGMAL